MTTGDSLDPAGLERLLEITGGDLEFVDELVDTFIVDSESQLAAMDAALVAGDLGALVRPAHSLKSNSDNVGATNLRDLARQLEADGKAGNVPDPTMTVAAIRVEFEVVRTALLEIRASR